MKPVMELLEMRRLLAAPAVVTATLGADGVLEIIGTRRADSISVVLHGPGADQIDLVVSGQPFQSFTQSSVHAIRMLLGSGNDNASIGSGIVVSSNIDGQRGNDIINGGNGNDTLIGGPGRDVLSGGAGDDVLRGDTSSDVLRGDDGDDNLDAGTGNDDLDGGSGSDFLTGFKGRDKLRGGLGDDDLDGGGSNDDLGGDDGNDRLRGDVGRDICDGGSGDDDIAGGRGRDRLRGGVGRDRFGDNPADRDLFEDRDANDDPRGADPLVATADLPAIVMQSLNALFPGATVRTIEKPEQAAITFQIDFFDAAGLRRRAAFSESGQLIQNGPDDGDDGGAVPSIDRRFDPVVLSGASLPTLQGIAPDRLVAFRVVSGNWEQVPVQVDERAVLDLNKPRNLLAVGHTALLYTDPNTWTGADPDPLLDADDEITFMAASAGGQALSSTTPDHVVPGSAVEIRLGDPLQANSAAWIYLFESDGALVPGAGAAPSVNYQFNLLSGDYKTTYNLTGGGNPESSTIQTANYSARFTDRWIHDELRITAGGATGADILEGHKVGFADLCVRTEETFSQGAGAMIANRSGPVRAIRSYLGANSGTFTQRDHFMYESRIDVVTYLRVHIVPALRDWIDYSADAVGMFYSASTNPSGVTIDGVPDSFPATIPSWSMVRGPQGAIVHINTLDSNIPGIPGSIEHYYVDDLTPDEVPCTGDLEQYGASGATINQIIPTTDPVETATNFLISTRRMTMLAPTATTADAQDISEQSSVPLTVTIASFRTWF